MTKRERFAQAALAGLLADHQDHADEIRNGETCAQAVGRLAVEFADATLAALQSQRPAPSRRNARK